MSSLVKERVHDGVEIYSIPIGFMCPVHSSTHVLELRKKLRWIFGVGSVVVTVVSKGRMLSLYDAIVAGNYETIPDLFCELNVNKGDNVCSPDRSSDCL